MAASHHQQMTEEGSWILRNGRDVKRGYEVVVPEKTAGNVDRAVELLTYEAVGRHSTIST